MNIFRNVSSNTKLTVKMILIPLHSVIYPQAASQHFPPPSFNSVKDRTVPAVMCWGLALDFSFQAWVSYWEQFDFPAVRYTNRSATVNVFSGHGYSHRLFQSGFSPLLGLMRGTPCHIYHVNGCLKDVFAVCGSGEQMKTEHFCFCISTFMFYQGEYADQKGVLKQFTAGAES